MANTGRGQRLRDRVKSIIGITDTTVSDSMVYAHLNDSQQRVAENTLCLERIGTLTLTSGVAPEPSDYFRMKLIVLASGKILQPIEVDVVEFDSASRLNPQNTFYTPIVYKRWVNTSNVNVITFFPTPTDPSYTLLYYAVPSTSIASNLDPEVPKRYDDVLVYDALTELLPIVGKFELSTYYRSLSEQVLATQFLSTRKQKTQSSQIAFYDY